MTSAIRNAIALGGGGLLLVGSSYVAGRCEGSNSATREAAQIVADSQAKIIANMVDERLKAALAQVQTRTVVREILTRPTPPRPVTPGNLPALSVDSLTKLVQARDVHIDTLTARLDSVRVAYGRSTS